MNYSVLITPRSFGKWDPEPIRLLEESGCELKHNPHQKPLSEDEMIEHIADADALLVGIDPVTENVLAAASKLKVISKYGSGLDNIDLSAASKRGLVVTHTPGANTEAVADHTFGLMLASSRLIVEAHNSVRAGNWERFLGIDLYKQTLGIIGTGKIGRAVARRAKGFEMDVLAYTRNPDHDWAEYSGSSYVELDTLLQASDFVSVNIALTAQTKDLINAEKINMMKPTAVIVNTSRGGIIDEDALADALEQGKIFSAALDVYTEEPVRNKKLLAQKRLITTPHIGAYSRGALLKMGLSAADNLLKVLNKEIPENVANPEVYNNLKEGDLN